MRFLCSWTLVLSLILFSSGGLAAETPQNPKQTPLLKHIDPFVDQIKWLPLQDTTFLTIFRKQTSQPTAKGSVILLHDTGQTPLWPYPIAHLRETITEHGWNSVAFALPPLPSINTTNQADIQEAKQQLSLSLKAVIEQVLYRENSSNNVIIAYGTSGLWVIDTLSQTPAPSITGLILLNAYAPLQSAPAQLEQLKKLNYLPILDLYTTNALNDARQKQAKQRAHFARTSHETHYQQTAFIGVPSSFQSLIPTLTNHINGWLNTHTTVMSSQKEEETEAAPTKKIKRKKSHRTT